MVFVAAIAEGYSLGSLVGRSTAQWKSGFLLKQCLSLQKWEVFFSFFPFCFFFPYSLLLPYKPVPCIFNKTHTYLKYKLGDVTNVYTCVTTTPIKMQNITTIPIKFSWPSADLEIKKIFRQLFFLSVLLPTWNNRAYRLFSTCWSRGPVLDSVFWNLT